MATALRDGLSALTLGLLAGMSTLGLGATSAVVVAAGTALFTFWLFRR